MSDSIFDLLEVLQYAPVNPRVTLNVMGCGFLFVSFTAALLDGCLNLCHVSLFQSNIESSFQCWVWLCLCHLWDDADPPAQISPAASLSLGLPLVYIGLL